MNFYLTEDGDLFNLSQIRYFIVRPSYAMDKDISWWICAYFSETDHRIMCSFPSEMEARNWIDQFLIEYLG